MLYGASKHTGRGVRSVVALSDMLARLRELEPCAAWKAKVSLSLSHHQSVLLFCSVLIVVLMTCIDFPLSSMQPLPVLCVGPTFDAIDVNLRNIGSDCGHMHALG